MTYKIYGPSSDTKELVLQAIKDGNKTVYDISKAIKVSKSTVFNAVRDLLKEDRIEEDDEKAKRKLPGIRPRQFSLPGQKPAKQESETEPPVLRGWWL